MVIIKEVKESCQMDVIRKLFREYQEFIGVDLCFQSFEEELKNLPGDYAPPKGRLFLASNDAVPVGCISLRAVDEKKCEMKRLFVRPQGQGLGIGRALVEIIIKEAKSIGYTEIVLDTLPQMKEAQHLYETLGFKDIPPYRENPVPGARYMGKIL